MIREFRTTEGIEYKASINFRTHRVSVKQNLYGHWVKYLKSCYLCKYEVIKIAYEMSSDEFEKFMKKENYWKVWK